jgi:hypothetical protein
MQHSLTLPSIAVTQTRPVASILEAAQERQSTSVVQCSAAKQQTRLDRWFVSPSTLLIEAGAIFHLARWALLDTPTLDLAFWQSSQPDAQVGTHGPAMVIDPDCRWNLVTGVVICLIP